MLKSQSMGTCENVKTKLKMENADRNEDGKKNPGL